MTIVERNIAVQESLHIDAIPERVWSIFKAVDAWPSWCPPVRRAKLLSGRLEKQGAEFEFTVKPWWTALHARATVMQSEPPHKIVWSVKKNGSYAQHSFTFEPEGAGTKATSFEVFSGPTLWGLYLVMPPSKVRVMFQSWLGALKTEAEKPSR